ncbi:MAG: uroporphyrinogen decarboxylase family protein [Nitrososphaeria archaeon]
MKDLSEELSLSGEVPVWFMRQAGRANPELSREIEEKWITGIAENPERAAEIAARPVITLGVSASIIFMDITTPFELQGFSVRPEKGYGPYFLGDPEEVISRAATPDERKWWPIKEQIRVLKSKGFKVIGFAGGPFTVLTYILNDRSRDKTATKNFLLVNYDKVSRSLFGMLRSLLKFELEAGADGFQIFDSWAGSLSGELAGAYVRALLEALSEEAEYIKRIIYFCRSCNAILRSLATSGYEGYLSVDWNCSMEELYRISGGRIGLQGNMDPFYALIGGDVMYREAERVIQSVPRRDRYIFSLGHGVIPGTPPENLKELAQYVRRWKRI